MNTTGRTARELCLAVQDADQRQRRAEADKVMALVALCDVYRGTDTWLDPSLPGSEQLVAVGADGTPVVSDFLALEVGAMLGMSEASAGMLLCDALNLHYRHPLLWQAICELKVEVWKARRIANDVARSGLPLEAALAIDAKITPFLDELAFGPLMRKLAKMIVTADEVLAEQRARKARQERFVRIRHDLDGVSTLVARIATSDAIALDAALTQAASDAILTGRPEGTDELRSEALGNLALAFLRDPTPATIPPARGILPQGTDWGSWKDNADGMGAAAHRGTAPGSGMDNGSEGDQPKVTPQRTAADEHRAPPLPPTAGRRVPRVAEIVIHISAESLARGDGIATVDGVGPMLLEQVREIVGGCRVRVQQVIDLNDDPSVESYEIPDRIRRHVTLRNPIEVFPFSSKSSANCDLDHTRPYRHGQGKPALQTRTSNLGPLSRKVHRAKTLGAWKLTQPTPGTFHWTSPMAFEYTVGRTGTTRGHTPLSSSSETKTARPARRKPLARRRP